jgi:hypothetical protein
LNEFLTIANVVRLVREWLGWMCEDCEVRFKVRFDIRLSNGESEGEGGGGGGGRGGGGGGGGV